MKNNIFLAAIFFLVLNLNAQTPWFGNGTGTKNDPYQITRPEQLDSVRYFRDAESENKHFRLMNDIDLTAFLAGYPTGWEGIGHKRDSTYDNAQQKWIYKDSLFPFMGHIYGGGHTISGFFSTYPYSPAAGLLCLLHGSIDSLTIITAENEAINGNIFVYQNDTTGIISNCSVFGTLTKAAFANKNLGVIKNCRYAGDITCNSFVVENRGLIENGVASIHLEALLSDSYVGGLSRENHGIIKNCHVTGKIDNGKTSGGIASRNESTGTITGCYTSLEISYIMITTSIAGGLVGINNGIIDSCYTIGNLTAYSEIGGLVGRNLGIVKNSYATGDVTQLGTGSVVGGLIGDNSGTVSNCYASGDVNGNQTCGGLVGVNKDTIKNCYAEGNVTSKQANVGGFAGRNNMLIENCRASGNVTGKANYVGGFSGYNSKLIANCQSSGKVKGEGRYTGGFVGINQAQIENCHATGDVEGEISLVAGFAGGNEMTGAFIKKSSSIGNVVGKGCVGGFVGENRVDIEECFSSGDVTGIHVASSIDWAGGFAGSIIGTGITSNCYAAGDVNAESFGSVGGFVGWNQTSLPDSAIKRCYVSNIPVGGTSNRGGFAGRGGINVWDCYFAYYGHQNVSELLFGRDPNLMLKQTTYLTWDFNTIWTIQEDITFPYFHWQNNLADTAVFEGTFVLNDSLSVHWRKNVDSIYFTVPYATTHANLSWIPDNSMKLERVLLDGVTLSNGENEFMVPVPVKNGIQPKMCKVVIYKNNGINDRRPPYLKNIFVSSGTIAAVDTLTFNYIVNVGRDIDKITIDAEAFYPGIMISGLVTDAALQGGENYFPIKTRSGNGMLTVDYLLTVIRAKSDNAFLENITLSDGLLSPVFHSDSLNYIVNIPNAVDTISITGIAADANAVVINIENAALTVGANNLSILVTAEDAVTTKTYHITVNRAGSTASDNARLQNIILSAGVLSGEFNPYQYYYDINLGYNQDKISIIGVPEDANAVVSNIYNAAVEVGKTVFKLMVTAENGATQIYYVAVMRDSASSSAETKLKNIIVSSGTLKPEFNPDIYSYTVEVGNLVDTISITGIPLDANATVQNVENAALRTGVNKFNLLVSDGNNHFQNYAVNVMRENADIVVITPEITFVVFEWQKRDGAKRYRLVIYTNITHTQEFGEYIFDEDGKIVKAGTYQYKVENLTPATNYYYALTAYDEDEETICVDEGEFTSLSESSITDNAQNTDITIYPNPTTGKLTIENGQSTIEKVEIFDIYGRIVGADLRVYPEKTIDISNLANGIYLIKINRKTIKIIKQ
jgi:hypothetical protein